MNYLSFAQFKTILSNLTSKIDSGAAEALTDPQMEGLLSLLGVIPGALDLGLPSGTQWLDKNVGASSATENGGYYAFGEPYTKSVYGFRNYLEIFSPCKPAAETTEVVYTGVPSYCDAWRSNRSYDDNTRMTYTGVAAKGIVSGNTLKNLYDAAAVNKEGTKMPTRAQIQELWDNTTHTYDAATNSIVFTATNGVSVSFPCSGCISGDANNANHHYSNPNGTNEGVGFGMWAVDGYGVDESGTSHNWFTFYATMANIVYKDGAITLAWVEDGGCCRGLATRPVVA